MYKRLAYLQLLLLEQLLLPLLPMILITLNLRVVGTSLQEIRMSLGTAQHPIYRLPQELPREPVQCPTVVPTETKTKWSVRFSVIR